MSKELVERLRNRNERYQGGFGNALMYMGADSILDCEAADEIERLNGIIEEALEYQEWGMLERALSKAHKVKE